MALVSTYHVCRQEPFKGPFDLLIYCGTPLSLLDSVLRMACDRFVVVFRLLDGAVDRLSKQIRGLTNLTLKITSTQPLSATSRHTAPFYPLPHPLAGGGGAAGVRRIPRCLEPTELLLQLEGSGTPEHEQTLYIPS